jgi:hypothetical protein
VLTAAGAVACLIGGVDRMHCTLILLAAGILAVGAVRTIREDENPAFKRKVLVVTSSGVIVRDTRGLRTWRFEELLDVVAGIYDRRPYLGLIDRNGVRHTFECLEFRRGERARRVISSRLHQPRLG